VPGTQRISKWRARIPEVGVFLVQIGSTLLKQHLRSLREDGEPEVHERVDLRAWTALGVGGLADLLIRCRSADGLQRAIDLLAAHGQHWLVLGAGSRVVPPPEGLRVPIVNLSGNLALWELDLDGAVAGGGANLAQVSRAAARTGLPGMARLMNSSSSVGGAVHSTARGGNLLEGLLDWIDLARPGGPIERKVFGHNNGPLRNEDLLLNRRVIVRARLQLAASNQGLEDSSLDAGPTRRIPRQPRSTAPAFAAPKDHVVEDLLAEAECAGLTAGGARLSKRFPNRICTSRASRSTDVAGLTRKIIRTVGDRTGIELRSALLFLDEDGREIDP
jgi:UDP-N-acetylmuramate dehydrogenase